MKARITGTAIAVAIVLATAPVAAEVSGAVKQPAEGKVLKQHPPATVGGVVQSSTAGQEAPPPPKPAPDPQPKPDPKPPPEDGLDPDRDRDSDIEEDRDSDTDVDKNPRRDTDAGSRFR
jgi:hypothetical protein